jgi:cell division protein FtsL
MSVAVRAPQRSRPATGPASARGSRPQLHVVGPPTRGRSVPSTRLIVAGGVALFLLLFALAAFQAVLVSSQQRLDELDRQVGVAQDRYQDLRVDVARLEAPERILSLAVHELGMVPSGQPTYVVPSDAVAAEVDARAAQTQAELADAASAGDANDVANEAAVPAEPSAASWPEVKPYLEPSP